MDNSTPPDRRVRFASGEITCSSAVVAALRTAGVSGLALLARHLCGDWGTISDEQRALNEQEVSSRSDLIALVSRHRLTTGVEVVITTYYPATPALRWTDLCLADEVITANDDDDDPLDLRLEAAMIMAEQTAVPALAGEGEE